MAGVVRNGQGVQSDGTLREPRNSDDRTVGGVADIHRGASGRSGHVVRAARGCCAIHQRDGHRFVVADQVRRSGYREEIGLQQKQPLFNVTDGHHPRGEVGVVGPCAIELRRIARRVAIEVADDFVRAVRYLPVVVEDGAIQWMMNMTITVAVMEAEAIITEGDDPDHIHSRQRPLRRHLHHLVLKELDHYLLLSLHLLNLLGELLEPVLDHHRELDGLLE